jgi:hypothetical protein
MEVPRCPGGHWAGIAYNVNCTGEARGIGLGGRLRGLREEKRKGWHQKRSGKWVKSFGGTTYRDLVGGVHFERALPLRPASQGPTPGILQMRG